MWGEEEERKQEVEGGRGREKNGFGVWFGLVRV